MPNKAQRSFSAGEVSPSLYGRVDIGAYQAGLRRLENGFVLRTGGVRSRGGTLYHDTTPGNGVARLIGWEFDAEETFLLEFSDGLIRFRLNGALLTPSLVADGGTWAAYAGGTTYAAGRFVLSSSIWYRSLQNANTGNTPVSSPLWWVAAPYYEVVSPYQDTDLDGIQVLQDVTGMRIAHPLYTPRILVRTANDDWSLLDIFFGFTIDAPASPTNDNLGTGGATYVVTAVTSIFEVESVASVETESNISILSLPGTPVTVSWTAVLGATSYNIYRAATRRSAAAGGYIANDYRYQGTVNAPTVAFADSSFFSTDADRHPPTAPGYFAQAGDYPGVIGGFQQRVLYSGSINEPATSRASRTALPDNFAPLDAASLVASDPVSWTQVAKKLNRTRHFVDLAQLLVLTSEGEWVVDGDESGLLLGSSPPNLRKFSEYGAAATPIPLIVGESVIFVQARGNVIRDLQGVQGQTLSGTDLTVTAEHLMQGHTIADWDYQRVPDSLIWIVRDDGLLLSLTYNRETGVFGWARHLTDGFVERVCVLPGTDRDIVYLVVRRVIDGNTVRYVEEMADRNADTPVLTDASRTVDFATYYGTLNLSNLVGVGAPDSYNLTIIPSIGWNGEPQAGAIIEFEYGGDTYRFTATGTGSAFSTTTLVPDPGSIPALFPDEVNIPAGDWRFISGFAPTSTIGGFDHLEGEAVSVVVDGVVVASPNNPAYATVTVTGGEITVASPWASVTVGLPYTVALETLDIDAVERTTKTGTFLIKQVGVWVEDSLGLMAGDSASTLQPYPVVDRDENAVTVPQTAYLTCNIEARHSAGGRILLQHVDPTPLTVLAIMPHGDFPR